MRLFKFLRSELRRLFFRKTHSTYLRPTLLRIEHYLRRLLPPRPQYKVRNKIGGGGRNQSVLRHTTKRQKSRAVAGALLVILIYFSLFYKFWVRYFS